MALSDMTHSGHSVGDGNGIILSVDSTICDLLQRPARELIGRSYLEITHPDDRAANARQIAALPEGQAPIVVRKRYLRCDGAAVPVDVAISRFTTSERQGRLVGTVRWRPEAAPRATPERLWHSARRVEALSDLRKQLLGPDLFPDHPMTILLRTYIAEMEGRTVTAAELARELELVGPLFERWLAALTARGLLDPAPRPDAPIQLSAAGLARLEQLLGAAS